VLTSVISIWVSGIIFAVIHSLLAQNRCKKLLYRAGLSTQKYRLSYVIFAIFTTLLWLAFVHSLPDTNLYHIDAPIAWLLRVIQLLGLALFLASLMPIDVRVFLGLRNNSGNIDPFIEKGIYCYVRHPMYLAMMLVMFAMPEQSVNSISLYTVVAIYFIIGAKLEEQRLILAHPEYKEYCHRVAAFVPFSKRTE